MTTLAFKNGKLRKGLKPSDLVKHLNRKSSKWWDKIFHAVHVQMAAQADIRDKARKKSYRDALQRRWSNKRTLRCAY